MNYRFSEIDYNLFAKELGFDIGVFVNLPSEYQKALTESLINSKSNVTKIERLNKLKNFLVYFKAQKDNNERGMKKLLSIFKK